MQTKKLLLAAAVLTAVIAGCKKEDPIPEGDPSIVITPTALTFEKTSDPKIISLTTNRDWKVVTDAKSTWITVTPASGKASASAQTITIAVDENTGEERSADLTFTTGSATTSVNITQSGAANKVYFNNFDKEPAVQTSNKWPYIYDTDCWKNQTGTGAANVTYITEGNKATIRNNSNSTGSGVNNVFFASDSRFCVKNIALTSGVNNYNLSFYGIRSVYGAAAGASVFDHSVFKMYISDDGSKWVQVDYVFEGGDPDNAWGQASTSFSVPSGTKTLCIGVTCPSEASTYRLDDLKLVESLKDTTVIDFTKGIEIAEFKEAAPFDPSKVEAKTVQEFITLADKNTYYKLTGSISSFNKTYCSFDLTDATGKINVYSVVDSCKTKYAELLSDGDVVTLAGKYEYYAKGSKHEAVNAIILSYKTPEHKTVTTDKVSEAIAAAVGDTVVLNGATVVAVANTSYLVTDATKTDYILVFQKTAGADTPVAIGDVVNVKSIRADYCSMPQLNSPTTTIVSSGTAVTWPEPEDITSTFDSFTSTTIKYISYTGTLSVSGSYYNVAVNGASTNVGSILPSTAADSWVGVPNTKFKGYYIYTSSSKYITIIFTEAEASTDPYLVVNPKSASVAATAGSTTINVSSNVDWTAESDNADFTVSPASGNGNGTITVTYPENTTESTKTANITVATATDTVKVAITQAKPGAATYTLQFTKNSNTGYASMFDVTVNGIDWKAPGNQGLDPDATHGGKIKIGGKLTGATDRYMYSKAPIGGALNTITFRHGAKDSQITVNSLTISSYASAADAESGSNAKDTKTVTYVDNDETSISVSGENWTGKYIRINYNLSSSAPSSNKGVVLFYVKFTY